MRSALPLLALLCLLASGCGKLVAPADPYNYVYPGSEQTRIQKKDEIADEVKLLPPKDRTIVADYAVDAQEAEQVYGKHVPDRTIKQVIALETAKYGGADVNYETGEIKPSSDQLYNEAATRQSQAQAQAQKMADMGKVVALSVLNKQSILNDSGRIAPGDQVVLTIAITNKGDKTITQLQGHIDVSSGSGAISGLDMHAKLNLPAGKSAGWVGTINLSGPQDQQLLNVAQNQLVLTFKPTTILFADGSAMRSNTP